MSHVLIGALLLAALLQQSPTLQFFSLQQDIEIGLESAREAENTLALVRDVHIDGYFRAIGERLAPHSPLPKLQYRFRIVNSKDVNSVTFPGGAVYMNRGLIELTENVHELAALLAHEIAHAAARHGTAQLSGQLLVRGGPTSIAAVTATRKGWKDQLSRLGIALGPRAPFLRYGHEQEVEANGLAIQILVKAGYAPQALPAILDKIQALSADGAHLPAYAYAHAQSAELLERVAADVEEVRKNASALSATPDFRRFHAALVKLAVPAKEPADIAPLVVEGTSLLTHPLEYYSLRHPEDWKVRPAGANGAMIAPPGGIQTTASGDDDLRIGVLLDIYDPGRLMTLGQATDRLIVHLRQANLWNCPGCQPLSMIPGAQSQITVSGEPALRTVLIGRPSSTQPPELMWLVTRQYHRTLFYMLCVAPEGEEFEKHQPSFEQIIRSVVLK